MCIHTWFLRNYHLEQSVRLHYSGLSAARQSSNNRNPNNQLRWCLQLGLTSPSIPEYKLCLGFYPACYLHWDHGFLGPKPRDYPNTQERSDIEKRNDLKKEDGQLKGRQKHYLNLTKADLRYRQTPTSPERQHTKVNCISSLCPIT